MSLYDYQTSKELSNKGYPFYALIMTAMRQAASENLKILRISFPSVWEELQKRYNTPKGKLEGDL